MRNTNFESETDLLQRCAQDDKAAQKEFSSLSYLNQIDRTIRETNKKFGGPLHPDEVEKLRDIFAVRVYDSWATLPHGNRTLYEQIHLWVFEAVKIYIRKFCR